MGKESFLCINNLVTAFEVLKIVFFRALLAWIYIAHYLPNWLCGFFVFLLLLLFHTLSHLPWLHGCIKEIDHLRILITTGQVHCWSQLMLLIRSCVLSEKLSHFLNFVNNLRGRCSASSSEDTHTHTYTHTQRTERDFCPI